MKKIFLLCSMMICWFLSFATESSPGVTAPPRHQLFVFKPVPKNAGTQNLLNILSPSFTCTGQITSTSVTPYPSSPGPCVLKVTTSGNPLNVTFFNTTQGASVSGYSYNATTGVATCNFYATGMGSVRIGINVTDTCGNVTTTYVIY